MSLAPPSTERIAVWEAMALHFLDTDSRQEIPETAMACIGAGLSVEQAREIWQHEVSPALAINLWSVAGEWSGWDRDWLIDRILKARRRRRGKLAYVLYRIEVHDNHDTWLAIERAMQRLLAAPAEQRAELARELGAEREAE